MSSAQSRQGVEMSASNARSLVPLTRLAINLEPQWLSDPSPLLPVIRQVATLTSEDLVIVLLGPIWSFLLDNIPASRWHLVQSFLGAIYGEAAQTVARCGRPDVDISVFFERTLETEARHDLGNLDGGDFQRSTFTIEDGRAKHIASSDISRLTGAPRNVSASTVAEPLQASEEAISVPRDAGYKHSEASQYGVVALGGTFDHLHAGHKVLLTMGVFLATKKLIVGVSGDQLLTKKSHAKLIEPIQLRIENVRDFLHELNPHLEYDIVPIHDVYGPTATDPNIQALVLSTESAQGGDMVAQARKEAKLPPLEIFSVDVVHSKSGSKPDTVATDVETLKELKLGSSHIRAWLAAGGRKDALEVATERAAWLEKWKQAKRSRPM